MHPSRFLTAAFVAVLSLPLSAATPAAPAASQPDPHAFDAVIQKLGDPAFSVREQAQSLLDQIPLSQRDALAAIADKTADEEIKARLIQHIGLMDERLATDPPPIAVDLQNATLAEVAKALGAATGTTFGTVLPQVGRYSLHVANQPLWEVLRQLSEQHPLWLVPSPGTSPPDRLTLSERDFNRMQIIRGIAFMADPATRAPANKVSLILNLALDPRIVVLNMHPMQVADARDDQGHLLHLDSEPVEAAARAAALRRATALSSSHFQSKTVTFTATDVPGKSLTVKGTASFLVEVAHASVDIANATKRLNQPIAVGDSTLTLREFLHSTPDAANPAGGAPPRKSVGLALQLIPKDSPTPAPDVPNIEISATGGISLKGGFTATGGSSMVIDTEGSAGGISVGAAAAATAEKTRILVTDATGKTVANYAVARGMPATSIHIVKDDFQEPLKFTLTYPTRTREVVLPFEFKELPIKP